MRPRKMTEPDEHSDACKWWQTLGNCTNGKHHLQAAAKPRASRQKRAPNGRYRSPAQRASGLSRVGQWRGGNRAPRRSPKRASARARAPDLRRGQRSGRKSHSNPKAQARLNNDDDALLGGEQGYEKSRRVPVRQPCPHERGEVPDTPREEGRNGDQEPRAIRNPRENHGASSESPHGWRGGEGGWVGVPRRKAHAGGLVRTRPLSPYQLISGRCGQVPAEMATVRSGNIRARRAGARQEPTRHFCAVADE